ncbi:MAG: DUF2157 domain-containing protein [Clostridia bacterium]
MSEKNIKWLYDELPKLVEQSILTDDDAAKVKSYYGIIDEKNWLKSALAIFGTLGAILIGAGIILLLAKNWPNLSRAARTVISLAPMIVGQILVAWVLYKEKQSDAWREGVSSFAMISIGAAIALIGQTYHIPGDMGSFLFSWMILSIPLVYLMKASVPGIFYLIAITAWAGTVQSEGGNALLFWLLAALMIPHIWGNFKKDLESNRSLFLSWAVSILFCIAIGITLEKVLPGLWIVIYSSYFAVLYLVGSLYFERSSGFWEQPFKVVGLGGILVLTVMCTYEWPWKSIGWSYYRNRPGFIEWAGIADYVLAAALFAVMLYLLYRFIRKSRNNVLSFGFVPVLSAIGYLIVSVTNDNFWMLIIYNVYLFALGLETVVRGIKNQKMGITNGGMLILSMMIVLRFFDADWGFATRGIAFISIGIGFLVSNYILWKKREGGTL